MSFFFSETQTELKSKESSLTNEFTYSLNKLRSGTSGYNLSSREFRQSPKLSLNADFEEQGELLTARIRLAAAKTLGGWKSPW